MQFFSSLEVFVKAQAVLMLQLIIVSYK